MRIRQKTDKKGRKRFTFKKMRVYLALLALLGVGVYVQLTSQIPLVQVQCTKLPFSMNNKLHETAVCLILLRVAPTYEIEE